MSTVSRAKRPILAIVVIIIVVAAAVGVYFATQTKPSVPVSTVSTSTSASLPSTLIVDEPNVVDSLDPAVTETVVGEELTQNVQLPLVICATEMCTSFLPELATSWTGSSNGLTYTFVLRNGAYFSNGDPFNAYVVWWNIYRDLWLNQAADFIFWLYFNTTGVSAAQVNSLNNAQNMPDANLLQVMENPHNSVTVLNATTVQFHLTNPFVAFMQSVGGGSPWTFVDPYVVEQHGGLVANLPNSWMTVNGTTVGIGPYITQVYVVDQYDVLVANPDYWAQNLTGSATNMELQPAKIPKVIVDFKTDELTRALDIQSGAAQAVAITQDDLKKVLPACHACYVPNLGSVGQVEWIGIDSLKAPLNNIFLRRAIIAAVNITQIQQVAYNGYITPFVGPQPTNFLYYNSSIPPAVYNVTLANQLLTEAGYPKGKGLSPIDFYYITGAVQTLVGELLKEDLAQIGITLNVHAVSAPTLLSLYGLPGQNATAPEMFLSTWSWYSDFSAYEYSIDNSLFTFGNMHNATIANLIIQSNMELNPTARAREISQIMLYVQQSASIIWVGQDVDSYGTGVNVFNKCVSGMYYNSGFGSGGTDFSSLYFTCAP